MPENKVRDSVCEDPDAVKEYAEHTARIGNQQEHQVGKLESLRRYPTACAWALFAVWYVLLVSFENQASGSILSIPKFREDFGYLYNGSWTLHANWQSAFSGAPLASYVRSNPRISCLWPSQLTRMPCNTVPSWDALAEVPLLISSGGSLSSSAHWP